MNDVAICNNIKLSLLMRSWKGLKGNINTLYSLNVLYKDLNLKNKIMKTLKLSDLVALISVTALIVLTVIAICNTTLYE
jgi:hypothetical protein